MKFIFLLFFALNASVVPYIYENGDDELKIFVAFDCRACKKTLKALFEYLKSCPKLKVKIYYYAKNEWDLELIAAILTLNQLQDVQNFLFNENFKKLVLENAKKRNDFETIKMHVLVMQEEIRALNIQGSPTLIFNDVYIIEGLFEAFFEIEEMRKTLKTA